MLDRCNVSNSDDGNGVIGDLLDIISIYLALKNLELNEQQVNDLNEHLKKQDNNYLQRAIEQNQQILDKLDKILSLMTDKRNG